MPLGSASQYCCPRCRTWSYSCGINYCHGDPIKTKARRTAVHALLNQIARETAVAA